MANCPKCKDAALAEAQGAFRTGEELPPPLHCPSCDGLWLPRQQAEQLGHGEEVKLVDHPPTDASRQEDKRAGLCPFGHGMMLRAKVEDGGVFWLDRCPHCGGIWFDAGEWNRLARGRLLRHLTELWDPAYRKKLLEERYHEERVAGLSALFGAEVVRKLIDVGAALRHHPHQSEALAFLQEELGKKS